MKGTRRRITSLLVLGIVASAVIAIAPAAAQDDGRLTSLEPLEMIIDSFGAGDDAGGLVGPGQSGSEEAITSQLQFIVNHGSDSTFGEDGREFVPTGLVPGEGLQLVSLEEFFGGRLEANDLLPPLDPWSAEGESLDISDLAAGWTAFGDQGPIEGPVTLTEVPSIVWGVELAVPFDTTCSSTSYVGRSWQGKSVTDDDPPFTSDALANWFGDTHQALADGETRLLQLACFEGGEPQVMGLRMTDTSARPFSPTKTVALVNGNRVLFFTPMRILDSDLDPSFFATPAGGGPIVRSETSGDIPVLVPNPYADFSIRVDLEELVEGEVLGLAPIRPQARTLLMPRGDGAALPASPGCPNSFASGLFFSPNPFEVIGFVFRQSSSTTAMVSVDSEAKLTASVATPFGTTERLSLGLKSGEGTIESQTRSGSPCSVPIQAVPTQLAPIAAVNGFGMDGATDPTPAPDDGPSGGSDDPGTDPGDDPAVVDTPAPAASDPGDGSGGGGFAVILVAFLVVLVLAAFLYWLLQMRGRPARSGSGPLGPAPDGSGELVDLVEEEDTTFEDPCWNERQRLQEAEGRLRALEAERRQVDADSETARALDGAIDNARTMVTSAQRIFDECWSPSEGTDSGTAGGGRTVGRTRTRVGGGTSIGRGGEFESTPRDDDDHGEACDWALYVVDGQRGLHVVRPAIGHECCRYIVSVETRVDTQEQATGARQDAPGDDAPRLRVPKAGRIRSGINVFAGASAVSGPAGRQDWMQGLGDPRPPEEKFASAADFEEQSQTLEEPLDVAAHIRHVETTTIECTLESECPDHENVFKINGGSAPVVRGAHECTNSDHDPTCPVELAAPARVRVSATGDLFFDAVADAGSGFDEIDRPAPDGHALTDGHDHETRERDVTFTHGGGSADRRKVQDRLVIDIETEISARASSIVPDAVADTTERVRAQSEAYTDTYLSVEADMRRVTCVQGDCHGHSTCNCDPSFHFAVTGGGAVVAWGFAWADLVRRKDTGTWEVL